MATLDSSEEKELELQTLGYGTSGEVSGEEKKADQGPPDKEEEEEEEEDEQTWEKKTWCEKLFRPLCPWLPWAKYRQRKKKANGKDRGQWDNRVQFILTLVGYAVGLGNVWRFPYLCARNGGATFIIPYITMLFVVGIPLFYLETTFGQMMRSGPINAWRKLVPNLWGIGLASVIVTTYINLYYNVIIAWVIFYFFSSFQDPLPWGKCANYTITTNVTLNNMHLQTFVGQPNYPAMVACFNDSTRYYWYTEAVGASTSIDYAGSFNWKIFLSLAAAWIITYLCMFRGIEWTGKVVYFTATFPYVVLIIMFFRAVTLEGAGEGIKFLFIPSADVIRDKFFQPQVWLEAATQIFFSLGLSLGAIIALSSYTKPSNNTLADSLVVCFTNSFTSIFASIIVFSIIGFRAHLHNVEVSLETEGAGLAFIVFSEALTLLPVSPIWALLFFFMLFLLGLDSQFAAMEAVLAALYDVKRIAKFRKEIVSGLTCLSLFIISFPYVLGNGLYLFELVDQFAGTIPLLVIGFLEIFTIAWVYGVDKFFAGVQTKVHRYMQFFWWIVWSFVSPVTMFIILFGSFIHEILKPLTYSVYAYMDSTEGSGGGIMVKTEQRLPYPSWAQFVGAVVVLSSVLSIPTVLIVRLIAFPEAREQALTFFREKREQAANCWERILNLKWRTWVYNRQIDDVEKLDNDSTPYLSAVDTPNGDTQIGTSQENTD